MKIASVAGRQRTVAGKRRILRGYAASRQAYDRRRRRRYLDAEGRTWRDVVQLDPCSWCGRRRPLVQVAADHVTPLSDGGRNIWENLAPACRACNAKKGNRSVMEMLVDG